MDEQNLSSVNAEPVANVEPQQETQVNETTESVNGEVATPQQNEKPVQSAEENAKYAAIRREAEQKAYQKAQDELIASMYGESHGIYTKADYDKAVAAQQEQQKLRELIEEKGVPEDVAQELMESKKFRQQYEAEQKTRAEQEARQKDFQSFIQTYPEVKAEEIPAEVWEENAKGKSLVDAYAKYENKLLKQQLDEFRKGQQAQQVNKSNAAASTGSVTLQGVDTSDFISRDVFEANKNNSSWLYKNYDLLEKSKLNWK